MSARTNYLGSDTSFAAGNVTTPGATTAVATLSGLAAGTYEVDVDVAFTSGTPAQLTDCFNWELLHGTTVVTSLLANSTDSAPITHHIPRLTIAGGESIILQTLSAGTTGVTYAGVIAATAVV